MPRKRELTWQPGSNGRPGRWRKIFHGKALYFDCGRGKSDDEAYHRAVDDWRKQQQEIRQSAPKQYRADYEAELETWQRVLEWSREHGDEPMSTVAVQRIQALRCELAKAKPSKVSAHLSFDGYFRQEIRDPALWKATKELGEYIANNRFTISNGGVNSEPKNTILEHDFQKPTSVGHVPVVIIPAERGGVDTIGQLDIERLIWRDRVEVAQRSVGSENKSVDSHIRNFLNSKSSGNGARSISLSRVNILRHHLEIFRDWLGIGAVVDKIRSKELIRYHQHLVEQIAARRIASSTADDRLSSVKSFVRWLWQIEAIEQLPRVLSQHTKILEIGKSRCSIETFTETEIATLFKAASISTRLYLMLTLNTGMTQKDMADLVHDEVDWDEGRIHRKRSKTRQFKNVPNVSYQLWPETRSLLSRLRSECSAKRVLLNRRGEPILTERIDAFGKFKKSDNVRRAFSRLRQKTQINKPFKSLKKTSASRLRSNSSFESIVGLFLGHAPRELSDRHYAAAPQNLLDDALCWLYGHYTSHNCFESNTVESSAESVSTLL
jgi:site-specific recombinase XerD